MEALLTSQIILEPRLSVFKMLHPVMLIFSVELLVGAELCASLTAALLYVSWRKQRCHYWHQ